MTARELFEEIEKIHSRPKPFEFYTASDLWTDEHTSEMMLGFHLNEDVDVSSRNGRFINRSVDWIASHFNVGPGTKIADFGCGPGRRGGAESAGRPTGLVGHNGPGNEGTDWGQFRTTISGGGGGAVVHRTTFITMVAITPLPGTAKSCRSM